MQTLSNSPGEEHGAQSFFHYLLSLSFLSFFPSLVPAIWSTERRYNDRHQERLCAGRRVASTSTRSAVEGSSSTPESRNIYDLSRPTCSLTPLNHQASLNSTRPAPCPQSRRILDAVFDSLPRHRSSVIRVTTIIFSSSSPVRISLEDYLYTFILYSRGWNKLITFLTILSST